MKDKKILLESGTEGTKQGTIAVLQTRGIVKTVHHVC